MATWAPCHYWTTCAVKARPDFLVGFVLARQKSFYKVLLRTNQIEHVPVPAKGRGKKKRKQPAPGELVFLLEKTSVLQNGALDLSYSIHRGTVSEDFLTEENLPKLRAVVQNYTDVPGGQKGEALVPATGTTVSFMSTDKCNSSTLPVESLSFSQALWALATRSMTQQSRVYMCYLI